jgi:hypothetical protein
MAWKAEVELIPGASMLGCPRRPCATPCRECIPFGPLFGPSHPALFIPDSDKNKASSRPVFEPTNMAGTPYASLMTAVFAIPASRFQ